MPPKTGKAAKESGKASMAIAEHKNAKTLYAIPALKEKKWTMIL